MGLAKSVAVAVALAVGLSVGCSSGTDGEPQDGAAIEWDTAIEVIPVAEARTGFAIADDAAIIGGGVIRQPGRRPTSTRDVWLQGSDGLVTRLPDLPADGIVEGLSGVRVGDIIVLGGLDCAWVDDHMGEGAPGCGSPRTRVLWSLGPTDQSWTRLDLDDVPDPPPSTLAWTEVNDPLKHLRVFGVRGNRALVALSNGDLTRFVSFDPASGSLDRAAEAPTTPLSSSTVPFCVDSSGQIFQVRAQWIEPEDPLGAPEAEVINVARLSPDGTWVEGPPVQLGQLDQGSTVSTLDIACLDGRDPLVSVSLRTRVNPPDPPAPVLAAVASDTLELRVVEPATDVLADLTSELADYLAEESGTEMTGAYLAVKGQTSDGELIVESSSDLVDQREGGASRALYTIEEDGDIAALDGFDSVESVSSVFVYAGRIGNVDAYFGKIRVRVQEP